MKIGKVIGLVAILSGMVAMIFLTEDARLLALNAGLSWTASYLLPRLIMLALTGLLVALVVPMFSVSKAARVMFGILILGGVVGAYLAVNLPYIGDWSRTGEELTDKYDGNAIEVMLNGQDSDFDGLLVMALPNCPYCFMAYPNLELLKLRNPELDVAVIVSARDSFGLTFFREHVGEGDIPSYLLTDREQATELSHGQFPTYLYFRNGRIIHRWSADQFGYPALDWVETKLQ